MDLNNPVFYKRFWSKVRQSPRGCWLWMGSTNFGYGLIAHRGRLIPAHRIAYQWLFGPLAPNEFLDHLCRVRRCVNPFHLEYVSFRENILRGIGPTAINHRKTHCVNGHKFDKSNTYIYEYFDGPHRFCRECRRTWVRKYYRQKHGIS